MSRSKSDELVELADLVIDPRCQRPLNVNKVNKMMLAFDPDFLGQLIVSRRKEGTLILLDGQHRRETVLRLVSNGRKVETILKAEVFEGLSLREEAELFLGFNFTSKPQWLDQFIVRITANDPDAVAIHHIIVDNGWKIGPNSNNGVVTALKTMERIYRDSRAAGFEEPNLAHTALAIVTQAWGFAHSGAKSAILEGVAAFILEYELAGYPIDVTRVITKLREFEGGPQNFLAQALMTARMQRIAAAMGVAERIRVEYNANKRIGSTLPPWTRRR